jgi:Ner family transcriptional regulator
MLERANKAQKQSQAKEDLHPALIVARLRMAGWSLRKLSEYWGLQPKTLSDALRRPWPRGEAIIAEALGCKPQEIWPSRYAARLAKRKKSTGGK